MRPVRAPLSSDAAPVVASFWCPRCGNPHEIPGLPERAFGACGGCGEILQYVGGPFAEVPDPKHLPVAEFVSYERTREHIRRAARGPSRIIQPQGGAIGPGSVVGPILTGR